MDRFFQLVKETERGRKMTSVVDAPLNPNKQRDRAMGMVQICSLHIDASFNMQHEVIG